MAIAAKKEGKFSDSQKVMMKWILNIVLSLGILFIPTSEVFTMPMKLFFASTVFGILLLALELTHMIVPALLIPISYVVLKLAPNEVIFQPWTTQIPCLLIGAFIITEIMEKTGLSRRIAYLCLLKTGGTYKGILAGALIGGLILCLAMPGAIPRTVLFCAIMMGICKALGYAPGSKQAAGLLFTAYIVTAALGSAIFTASSTNVLLASFLEPYGISVSFVDWLIYAGVPFTIWAVVSLGLIYVMYGDKKGTASSKDYLQEEYAKLGKVSAQEKKIMFILVIAIVLFATTKLHGVQAGFILSLAALFCFVPQVGLANEETLKKVNFPMIFLTVGMISIGNVSTAVGAGNFIADAMLPLMPEDITMASLFIYPIVYIGNILLTPLALISGLLTPILEVANTMGWNTLGTALVFGASLENIILPHEIVNALVIFSFGMMSLKEFMKFFVIRSILFIGALMLIFIPWFNLVGIL